MIDHDLIARSHGGRQVEGAGHKAVDLEDISGVVVLPAVGGVALVVFQRLVLVAVVGRVRAAHADGSGSLVQNLQIPQAVLVGLGLEAHAVAGGRGGQVGAVGHLEIEVGLVALGELDGVDGSGLSRGKDLVRNRDGDAVHLDPGESGGEAHALGGMVNHDLIAVGDGSGQNVGALGLGGGLGFRLVRGRGVLGDRDAAFAVPVVVDAGVQAGGKGFAVEVVDQDLVVQHAAVADDGVVHEHVQTVAALLEHIVVGGDLVGLGQVDRLVFAGGLVEDLHAADAALAVHLGEHAGGIGHDGAGRAGVDGVFQAGDLEEAAALAGEQAILGVVDGAGGHFKGVDNLLAGGLDHDELIAEGMDLDDPVVGHVAGGDVGADAAAVDNADVGVAGQHVSISADVAEVGLLPADGADVAVQIPDGEVLGQALDHDGVQQLLEVRHHFSDRRSDGFVLLGEVGGGDQLGVELAILGDGQLAHVGQLGAGGGEDDVLAVLVGHGLHRDDAVRVAVEHGVDAGGIGDHVHGAPGSGALVGAQVGQRHDVVHALGAGSVNRSLHGLIEGRAGGVVAEVIDPVALGILEVGRGGLDQGFGGGDADVGDPKVAVFDDGIGVEIHGVRRAGGAGVAPVGGDDVEVRLFDQRADVVHAVVEFVVAERGGFIADLVHQTDDGGALGQRADGLALDEVAGVNQADRIVQGLHIGLVGGQAVVAEALAGIGAGIVFGVLNAAVDVVGVEDDQIVPVLQLELGQTEQNGGNLRAGGGALRAEVCLAVRADALDQTDGHSPGHGVLRVGADGAGIREGAQVGPVGNVAAGVGNVAIEEGGKLFAVDLADAVEDRGGLAGGDPVLIGPEDGLVGVAAGLDVGEGILNGGLGLAFHSPEDGDKLLAGQGVVRPEDGIGLADHDTLVEDVVDALVVPGITIHVGEFRAGIVVDADLLTGTHAQTLDVLVFADAGIVVGVAGALVHVAGAEADALDAHADGGVVQTLVILLDVVVDEQGSDLAGAVVHVDVVDDALGLVDIGDDAGDLDQVADVVVTHGLGAGDGLGVDRDDLVGDDLDGAVVVVAEVQLDLAAVVGHAAVDADLLADVVVAGDREAVDAAGLVLNVDAVEEGGVLVVVGGVGHDRALDGELLADRAVMDLGDRGDLVGLVAVLDVVQNVHDQAVVLILLVGGSAGLEVIVGNEAGAAADQEAAAGQSLAGHQVEGVLLRHDGVAVVVGHVGGAGEVVLVAGDPGGLVRHDQRSHLGLGAGLGDDAGAVVVLILAVGGDVDAGGEAVVAQQLPAVEVDAVGLVGLHLVIDHDAADEAGLGPDCLVDEVGDGGRGVLVGILAVRILFGIVVSVGLGEVDDVAPVCRVVGDGCQLVLGPDRGRGGLVLSGHGEDDHLILGKVFLRHLARVDILDQDAVLGADLDEGALVSGIVAGDVEVGVASVQADVGHQLGRIGGLGEGLGVGLGLALIGEGEFRNDLIGFGCGGVGGLRGKGSGEGLHAAGGELLGEVGGLEDHVAVGGDLPAVEEDGLGLAAVGQLGGDGLLDALGRDCGGGGGVHVDGNGLGGPDGGGHGDVAVGLDDLHVVVAGGQAAVGILVVDHDVALVGVAGDGDFLDDLGALADDLDGADVLKVGLVDGQTDRDLIGLLAVLDGGNVAELVGLTVDVHLVVDLQVLVLGRIDAAGVQRTVDADFGEVVGQDDVAAGVGAAPVALVVILVVRGADVPAHGQAEVILLIGGEVGGAADLAFAVADLDQVQDVVALGGAAGVVIEVAEGLAGVVKLGDDGHGSAVCIEGDILGGVDAGDLRSVAGDLGLIAVHVKTLVGVCHQVVVQVHAGVLGLVVERLVVAGDGAVGVEGVGVAGAAGPGHLVTVHADEVVPLVVVGPGSCAGLFPLRHGAAARLEQGAQIVVAGGGGGRGGVKVVGVVGHDQEVHVVHAVGVLIGVLKLTGAVGILGGVGVNLTEEQGFAARADEEVPVLDGLLAVGTGDGEGQRVLAGRQIGGGNVGIDAVGCRAVDGGLVHQELKARVAADVGVMDGDFGADHIAGGGVGLRGHGEDQRLVADLNGLGAGEAEVHGVLDLDDDGQGAAALQVGGGDREGADLAGHGGVGGLLGGLAVEAVADGHGVQLVEVVDRELHRAVGADGGSRGLGEEDARIDHVAAVILVFDVIEVHGEDLGGAGIVGVAGEEIVKILDVDRVALPARGLVLHEPAAADFGNGPLGVVVFGVHQDQALVVDGLSAVVLIVLGHAEVLASGLEGVLVAVDVDREDQAAVGDVLVADAGVGADRGSAGQIGLGCILRGGLSEDCLGVVVVDDHGVAVGGQSVRLFDLAHAAVVILRGRSELHLEILRGGSLVGVAAELLAVVLLQIYVGRAVPLVLRVQDVERVFSAGLVGDDRPLRARFGGVDEDHLFLALAGILDGKVLAAQREIVGAVAVLDEANDGGSVRELVDRLAVRRQADSHGGGIAAGDVIAQNVAGFAVRAGVEDHAVGPVRGCRGQERGASVHLHVRSQRERREDGENHGKDKQHRKRSCEVLFHRIPSCLLIAGKRAERRSSTYMLLVSYHTFRRNATIFLQFP